MTPPIPSPTAYIREKLIQARNFDYIPERSRATDRTQTLSKIGLTIYSIYLGFFLIAIISLLLFEPSTFTASLFTIPITLIMIYAVFLKPLRALRHTYRHGIRSYSPLVYLFFATFVSIGIPLQDFEAECPRFLTVG